MSAIGTPRLGLPVTDRYITIGGSHHYRVRPYMPDMSWLGEAPSLRMAQRYEVTRRLILERNARDLALEIDCASGTSRAGKIVELNAIHAELARTGAT